MITAEQFTKAVGHPPEDDDLERVNCPRAGTPAHWDCGWCYSENKPNFMVPLADRDKHK